jgi:hypothetical protein
VVTARDFIANERDRKKRRERGLLKLPEGSVADFSEGRSSAHAGLKAANRLLAAELTNPSTR